MKNYFIFVILFHIGCILQTISAQEVRPLISLGVGYTNNQVDGYWGEENKAHISTAIRLTASMMNGSQIIAMKCAIAPLEKATDCKLFIKRNIFEDENLYEQEFTPIFGWNYIYLNHPFNISEINELYIGYEITSSGEFIGYEQIKENKTDADFIRINNGKWGHLSQLQEANVTHCITAIMAGGEYRAYEQNCADIQDVTMPKIVKADTAFHLKGILINRGVCTLHNFSITYKINNKEKIVCKQETDLLNLETVPFSFPLELSQGKNILSIQLSEANGESGEILFDNTYTIEAYEKAFPHAMLVEYFTGQGCAYCPAGKINLDKAIKKYENQTVLMLHHAGFAEDIFTIPESIDLTNLWEINSAPNMILERSNTNINGKSTLVFHPNDITSDIIKNHTIDAALVGIQMENSFYKEDSILVIKVHVEKDREFSKTAKLHVYLCENGYVAPQSGGVANYIHNHFPRKILSEIEGDNLSYNQENCSETTYQYKIPTKYTIYNRESSTSSHPEKMEIVAFVAEFDKSSKNYSVYNAITQPLKILDGSSAIESTTKDYNQPFTIIQAESGNISIIGEFNTALIYTISGIVVKQLKKDDSVKLSKGIYIVKVATNTKVKSQKIIIY